MSIVVHLTQETEAILYLRKKDKRLSKVIDMVGNYTYKPYEDSFEFLTNQIIGQMLSVKVAAKISERTNALCSGRVNPESILVLEEGELRKTGMSSTKEKYIRNLALLVNNKELCFDDLKELDDLEIMKRLTCIKGIGNWTAKMYLIFVLDRQDVLPLEDMAFLQAYSWLYKTSDLSKSSIEKNCKKWKPYSSIASRYLYKALDSGLTKKEFSLYK